MSKGLDIGWVVGVSLVVPSPAKTTNCASFANLSSVLSAAGRELSSMPPKMVSFARSGLLEFLISRTFFIHHCSPVVSNNIEMINDAGQIPLCGPQSQSSSD